MTRTSISSPPTAPSSPIIRSAIFGSAAASCRSAPCASAAFRSALGTDESAADDSANLWGVIKTAGLIHNLSDMDYQRWPKAGEILDCVFTGGARAMHATGEIGEIAAGHHADIVLLDLDTAAFTPLNDISRQMVYCENGSSVALTMVDGTVVFESGKITTVDEKALRTEAREIFAARRPALAEAARQADAWLPSYREMVLRAARQDIGMNRRLGGFL